MCQSHQHNVSVAVSAINTDLEAGQLLLADTLNLAEELTNSSTVWHTHICLHGHTYTNSPSQVLTASFCPAGGAAGSSGGAVAPPAEEAGGRSGSGAEGDRRPGEGFPGRKPRPHAAQPRPLPPEVGLVLVWWWPPSGSNRYCSVLLPACLLPSSLWSVCNLSRNGSRLVEMKDDITKQVDSAKQKASDAQLSASIALNTVGWTMSADSG